MVARALNLSLSCVESFRPDIVTVIVELGTTDLTRFGPAEVGSNLEEFARNLHANYGVKLVCVNQIFFRAQSPLFNAKVRVLNRYLNAVLEQLPFAIFWRHRGFWNCANNLYVISRCCFAEDGYEMCQGLLCTCRAIVLLIKAFVLPRSRCRCRRGFLTKVSIRLC